MSKFTLKEKNNIKAIKNVIDMDGSLGVFDAGAGNQYEPPRMVLYTITASNAGRLHIILKENDE